MRGFKYAVTKAFANKLRGRMLHGEPSSKGGGFEGFVKAVNSLGGLDEEDSNSETASVAPSEDRSWPGRMLEYFCVTVAVSRLLIVWLLAIVFIVLPAIAIVCFAIYFMFSGGVFALAIGFGLILGFASSREA